MTDAPKPAEETLERQVSLIRTGDQAADALIEIFTEKLRAALAECENGTVTIASLANCMMLFLCVAPRDQARDIVSMIMLALASDYGQVVKLPRPPVPPTPKEKVN